MKTRAYTVWIVPKENPNDEAKKITNCQINNDYAESVNKSFEMAEKHLYAFVPDGYFMVKYQDQTKIGV